MRLIRSPWLWAAVAALLVLGYLASPIIAAADLARAVQQHDVAEIRARLDEPAIRRSLTRQIFRGYLALNNKDEELGPFSQQVALAVAITVLDPIAAAMTTPEAIADFLSKGWPKIAPPDPMDERTMQIGSVWDLLGRLQSVDYVGLREFRVVVDVDGTRERRLGWRFRLQGATWRLASVELPPELVARIVSRLPPMDKLKIQNPLGR